MATVGPSTLERHIPLMFAACEAEMRINELAEDQGNAALDYVTRRPWLAVEAIPERLEPKHRTGTVVTMGATQ